MFKKILLATDGSPLSDKAIKSTLQFAKEHGSKIVGVCVATISPYFPLFGMEVVSGEFIDAITIEAGKNVGKISALARSMGCLLYTSPSPRDLSTSRMPSSA